jgi:hypothetical protein
MKMNPSSCGIGLLCALLTSAVVLTFVQLRSAHAAEKQGIFVSDYQRSRTKRPLEDAVAECNAAQARNPVGSRQRQLTAEEIKTALKYQHLINDMPEKMDEFITIVLDRGELPPGALLTYAGHGAADVAGGVWVVTLSFFMGDPALLVEVPQDSADRGMRYDVVIRADFSAVAGSP